MRYLFFCVFLMGCATTKQVKGNRNIPVELEVVQPNLEQHLKEKKEIKKNNIQAQKKESIKSNQETKKEVKIVKEKPLFQEEKAVYDISLKGVHSGTAVIKAMGEDQNLEYFFAHIKTSSFISMFFKVEHKIKSLWNKKTGSHYFSFDGVEGPTRKKRVQEVDKENNLVDVLDYQEKGGKKHEKKFKKPWIPPTQDFLSSFFFVRTINWIKQRQKKFLVLDNGKVQKVEGVYRGLENIRINGKNYETKVVEVRLQNGGSSLNKFWISKNNLLVKIQANLKIGVMVFELDGYSKGQ